MKKDVYLIEKIQNPSEGKMTHLKGVYFVRPTEKNFKEIISEIRNPRFLEYYLFFSSQVSTMYLESLAENDSNDIIK